MSLYVQASFA